MEEPVKRINDQTYLKEKQYKTSDNLQARINLHIRFGTNPYPWPRWVFDQLALEPGMRVLDIGCGPSDLWRENTERLPEGLFAVLGDLSIGMAQQARQGLLGAPGFSFTNIDAQTLPLPGGYFDVVTANHMLYHVPDINRALLEIKRVLKPGGLFVAGTNGEEHMRELSEMVQAYVPDYKVVHEQPRRFSLENAPAYLDPLFDRVEVRSFDEDLVVTEVEPLVAYIRSMWSYVADPENDREAGLEDFVRRNFNARGQFFITKSQGVVVGRKDGS